MATHNQEDTFTKTVRDLCDQVDYWKRRAAKAEETLEKERLQSLKTSGLMNHPDFKKADTFIMGLLGQPSSEARLKQLEEKEKEPWG